MLLIDMEAVPGHFVVTLRKSVTFLGINMGTLQSADRMVSVQNNGHYVPVTLRRESEGGIIFISCDDMPELFIAVRSDEEIRNALDCGLKGAFSRDGRRVQVFTNGKITEPLIDAVVCLTEIDI